MGRSYKLMNLFESILNEADENQDGQQQQEEQGQGEEKKEEAPKQQQQPEKKEKEPQQQQDKKDKFSISTLLLNYLNRDENKWRSKNCVEFAYDFAGTIGNELDKILKDDNSRTKDYENLHTSVWGKNDYKNNVSLAKQLQYKINDGNLKKEVNYFKNILSSLKKVVGSDNYCLVLTTANNSKLGILINASSGHLEICDKRFFTGVESNLSNTLNSRINNTSRNYNISQQASANNTNIYSNLSSSLNVNSGFTLNDMLNGQKILAYVQGSTDDKSNFVEFLAPFYNLKIVPKTIGFCQMNMSAYNNEVNKRNSEFERLKNNNIFKQTAKDSVTKYLGNDSIVKNGMPSGMNRESTIMDSVLRRIREYFRYNRHFMESQNFSTKDFVNPASIEEWNGVDSKKVLTAAKRGEKSALEYLFYKADPLVKSIYWKNFLGPNGLARSNRIRNGSREDWLSIAWITLTDGYTEGTRLNGEEKNQKGAIELYMPSKVTGNPLTAFMSIYRLKLMDAAKEANRASNNHGINADIADDQNIHVGDLKMYDDSDREAVPEEYIQKDDTSENMMMSIEDEEFMENWSSFVQDETLQKENSKGFSAAKVFKCVLKNKKAKNMKELAAKIGMSRGTFETYLNNAVALLKKYDISQEALYRAIDSIGEKKLASYL